MTTLRPFCVHPVTFAALTHHTAACRFIDKRNRRVWTKKVKYDVRKNFADSRVRVKGRFVKKEAEDVLRQLLTDDGSADA